MTSPNPYRDMLIQCREQFQLYGDLHSAKDPPQTEKAAVNYALVADINRALNSEGDPEAAELALERVKQEHAMTRASPPPNLEGWPAEHTQVGDETIRVAEACEHRWRYEGTDPHGSRKGEDRYWCSWCGKREYRV